MGFKYGNLEGTRRPFHIGTGTPDASAQLQADSTTRGFLMPRVTSAQRLAIATPAEGLQVFDTDIKRLFLYADGSWTREEAESIESDLTMYVDGTAGNDTNDGLTWLTAKKTFAFLRSSSSDAIPRAINADLLVSFRNNIRASSADGLLVVDGFYGNGTIIIQGELTAVETFTATGYENDELVQGSQQWVSDATKSWTPDQWRRHFVDLGHTYKYPIRTNNATTLWMGFGDEQSGAYAATIYSASEILRELDSNPGVKYAFDYDKFVNIHDCNLKVTIRNAWIDDDSTAYFMIFIQFCTEVTFEYVSAGNLGTYTCGYFSLDQSYLNLTNYGYWLLADGYAGMQNSAIDSVDLTGYGVYINGNGSCWFAECWIGHQIVGIDASENSTIGMNRSVYIQECDIGIYLRGADLDCNTPMPEPLQLRFDTIGKAITGLGRVYKTNAFEIIGFDVTNEFYFSDTDTGTFLDFSNDVLRSRLQIQFAYANSDYEPVYFDEYDNDASGLTATRFQTAIDELASNQAAEVLTSPLTMYVDGDAGDDANDGLAWGTAKKTFGFLNPGEADSIPREINSTFICYFRGDILARSADGHLRVHGFFGTGTMSFIGTLTSEETLTCTTYENNGAVRHGRISVTDGTKAWTPGAWRRHFLKITGDANYYPIYDNTETTLYFPRTANITGTPAATIYSAPELLAELVTNPGVKYNFETQPPAYLAVTNCNLSVSIKNLWSDELGTYRATLYIDSSVIALFTNIAVTSVFSNFIDRANYEGCYFNLSEVGYIIDSLCYSYFIRCAFDSLDDTGWGYNSYSHATAYIFGCIFNRQEYAVYSYFYGGIALAGEIVIRNSKWGIMLGTGQIDLTASGASPHLTFDTVEVGIRGIGDISLWGARVTAAWDVTTEVLFGETDEGSFADLDAKTLQSRAGLNFIEVTSDWEILPSNEYDNTASGLTAVRYQTAIDEIAANQAAEAITSPLTMYVDGTTGDDANDGLAWGTAKKTLGFLVEGEADSLPREINAAVTINVRGPIRARSATVPPFFIYLFYGSGSITITGELTAEETFTASTYDNVITNKGSLQWLTDGTKAWTPGEWRRHFVDIGASDMYPIRNNTGTTLYTSMMRAVAGTPAGTIYSAPEVLSELASDPGTKHDFSTTPVIVASCEIGVTITQLWFDEYFALNSFLSTNNQNGIYLNKVSLPAFFSYQDKYFTLSVFYANHLNYTYSMVQGGQAYIDYGAIDSADATGYGVYTTSPGLIAFYRTWIGNQVTALWIAPFVHCHAQDNLYIQDCTDGVLLFGGCFYGEIAASGYMARFDGVTRGIVGHGSIIKLDSLDVIGWDVTDEVVFSDTDSGTFAALTANTLASRLGINILSFDSDYRPVLLDEYDNTASGLTATRFQTAIDEVDGNLDTSWVDEQRYGLVAPDTTTTIAFDSGTYEFTLGSVGATWAYWRAGVRHVITGDKSVTLAGTPPTAGTYFVVLDSTDGTLTASTDPWTLADTEVPVAIIAWDDTATPKHLLADERHSCEIHRAYHREHHFADGSELVTGGLVSDYVVNEGEPNSDDDNTFSIEETVFFDEDKIVTCAALSDPSGSGGDCMTMTRTGADTYGWAWSDVPFVFTPSGYINWNNGGTATEGQSGKFYCTYLFATNYAGAGRFLNLLGRGEYDTLSEAQDENLGLFDLTGFPVAESIALYRFVWATDSTYATKGKVRLAADPAAIMESFTSLQNRALSKTVRVLTDLNDVIIDTPLVGQLLGYNGLQWVNTNAATSGTGPGLEFYFDDTSVIAAGAENANALVVLATTPTTDVEGTETVVVNNNTVVCKAYLTSAALGRTTIDGGAWEYRVWAGVNNTAGVTTLQASVYKVSPELVQTVTTTGTGTTRTCTASGGSFWVSGDANANPSLSGYVQTPKGLYQITAYTSSTEVTIATPTGYTNESTVAFSTWKYGFLFQTDDINSVTTSYTAFSRQTVQASIVSAMTDKLGVVVTGSTTRTSNTTITWTREGTERHSYVSSPMGATHEQLSTLLGGAANDHYHLTGANVTTLGGVLAAAQGDILYSSAPNVWSRLAKSTTAGHILTNSGSSNNPAWAAPAVPASITVADTADTTCFVALFEEATGNLGPKTDAALLYNAATGALSSTLFAANTITANIAFVPDANDGAALGTTALQFSDVFLAAGGVVNWDNGNTTLTHAAGILTLSGVKFATGGETAPDCDVGGICINQGANDGYSFTIKSSDVSHPFTDIVETDTYLRINKTSNTEGGANIIGVSEASVGIGLLLGGMCSTPVSGTSDGCVAIVGYDSNGAASVAVLADTENLAAFRNWTTTKIVVKGSGDLLTVAGIKVGAYAQVAAAGAIQWSGTNFQGHNGSDWVNLDIVVPTTITVADTTDTTCYVALFEDATGNLAPKTDAALLYNASTGALSSTLFAANTITANTAFVPDVSDGATLGTALLPFSDVFLASGAVTNWANGDVTLTHATGILTFNAVKIGTGGETAPDVDPGGLCLNHGAGADTVLSAKSSDVAHPFTSFAQTDTYFELRKNVAASGGSVIRSFTEGTSAVEYRGYSVTASTSDYACVQLSANYTDGGTGVTTFSNNSNIVGFRNTTVMKHQFKGGGDAVFVGALTVGARVATSPPAGTIQWSGTEFQGYDGALWRTFDNHWIVPADHSWSGNTMTATAGETVAMGDLCYLKSDGKFWLADADAQATSDGMLALATAAIAGDAAGVFLLRGLFRDDSWTWTVGGAFYVNTTGGAPVQTAPSATGDIVRIVGHAYNADVIYFNPDNTFVELT